MLCRVRVFSLFLCLAVSSSCCCSIPSPFDCLRCLCAAGVSRCSCITRPPVENERPWCALIRNPSSARQRAPPPNVPARVRVRARVCCVCVCVCIWRCAAQKEWMSVSRVDRVSHPAEPEIQLLPGFLTADYCSRHALMETNTASPPPFVKSLMLLCFYYRGCCVCVWLIGAQ